MNLTLKDEVAVVTGGGSGIGKAIVKKYAQEGAKIAFLGTNVQKAQESMKEIRDEIPGVEIAFFAANVANKAETDRAMQQVLDLFGKIDILVNNAGITADQLLMKMTEEEWDKVIDINLKSCFNLCQFVIRPMMKARKGIIINISSIVGLIGNPGQTNYAASKAGMIGFTKALAKEVASRNVRVNCITPGFVETLMTEAMAPGQMDKFLPLIPLGRMGKPEEIAQVAWFLATNLSSYMTGQVLSVDGGMVM